MNPVVAFVSNIRNTPAIIIGAAFIVFLSLFVLEVLGRNELHDNVFSEPKREKQKDMKEQVIGLADDLNLTFREMNLLEKQVVDTIYKYYQPRQWGSLGGQLKTRDSLDKQLKLLYDKHDWIYGLGYALESPPKTADHYALYYYRLHGDTNTKNIVDSYNYLESEWYKQLKESKRWLPPYYGTVASVKLIERGRPLKLGTSAPFGVTYVDIKADYVKKMISESLDLGLNGFSIVFKEEKSTDKQKYNYEPILWSNSNEALNTEVIDIYEVLLEKIESLKCSDNSDNKKCQKSDKDELITVSIGGQNYLWSSAELLDFDKQTNWKIFAFYPVSDIEISDTRWSYSGLKMFAYLIIAFYLLFQFRNKKVHIDTVKGVRIAFLATIPMVVLQTFHFANLNTKGYDTKKESIVNQLDQATILIEDRLEVLKKVTRQIKDSINYKEMNIARDSSNINSKLREILQSYPDIFGLGICWQPEEFTRDLKELYAPFFFRTEESKRDFVFTLINNVPEKIQTEFKSLKPYNYLDPNYEKSEWYHIIKDSDSAWIEPYYGQIAQTILTEYGEPFYASKQDSIDDKPLGIVFADYSLKQLKQIVESLRIGRTGYSYIVSDNLNLIYTPENGYTEKTKLDKLEDRLEKRPNDFSLDNFTDFLQKKEHHKTPKGIHDEYVDALTGVKKWRAYSKFPNKEWTLVSVFPLDQLQVDSDLIRKESIVAGIWFIAFLAFFVIWICLKQRREKDKEQSHPKNPNYKLWKMSNLLALVFLLGTVLIWYSAYYFNDGYNSTKDKIVKETADVLDLKDEEEVVKAPLKITNNLTSDLYLQRVRFLKDYRQIPSALNIETLEFVDANDVRLSGVLWQYLDKSMVDKNNPMPELRFKNALETEFIIDKSNGEQFKDSTKTEELFKWYFTVSLRQNFDYSKYPFDSKALTIHMGPRNMDMGYVLVPHFDSYMVNSNDEPITSPKSKPGLSVYLSLTDWTISESYFNYNEPIMKSNFGLDERKLSTNKIELNYSIITKRNFVGPFIGDLLPFLVISIFLFALFKGLKDPANRKEGVKAEIVDTAAALFFSLLVSHFKLRDLLEFNKVVYVETFYFILYLAIVFFLINRILYRNQKFKWLNRNNNENVKMLYWPFISISVWLVAVLTFI